MARLSLAEKRLLRYPPTLTTWECLGTYMVDGEKKRCGALNPGKSKSCFLCRRAKPKRPKQVWPQYEAACRKAGIQPGDRWRDPSDAVELAAAWRQRKKGSK